MIGLLLAALLAAPAGDRPDAAVVTPAAERAIAAALTWLATEQHDDGSWGTGGYRGNAAVTGLVGMAFLAAGSTPGRGPYGRHIDRGLDYLLATAEPSGFVSTARAAGHGPMYGHGFATLYLAECCGMSPRGEVRELLGRAVNLIVNTQNKEGGWRYFPQRGDADLSVTVCQVMALRAARNAGVLVPRQTIDRSVEYVRRSQNPDGGFMYMLDGGESGFSRSAAGLVALYGAGLYDGPEVRKAHAYLLRFQPKPGVAGREMYYEYGHYYAMQAMWQAGGAAWRGWYAAVRDELISRQQAGGAWTSPICSHYATSMAALALEVPNNLLPIFQR